MKKELKVKETYLRKLEKLRKEPFIRINKFSDFFKLKEE